MPARRRLTLLILLLASACAHFAAAQSPASTPAQPNPRNFDASQFGDYVSVSPDWLFAAGDNPAWASSAFDDSAWRIISTGKPLAESGILNLPYVWYRIHIHLRPGTQNLMVGITNVSGFYEVYANGVLLGGNRNTWERRLSSQSALVAYSVPDSLVAGRDDLLLALRCANSWGTATAITRSTPLSPNSVYLLSQKSAPIFTSYVASHNAGPSALLGGLALLVGLIALALYLVMRSQQEYLAIAICLIAASIVAAMLVWFRLSYLSFPMFFVQFVVLAVEMVALIEFVRLVLHLPRSRWLLALEAITFLAFTISPLHEGGFISDPVFIAGFIVPVAILKLVLPLLLVRGWLRGNREARLLLPAILLGCFADYWTFLRSILTYAHFNALLSYLPFAVPFGTYQIDFYRVGDFAFYVAILIFLIQRTVRIARERTLAAAELEAARTVQQILIPEQIPTIPGFVLHSVYKPAGQVGGDFFQILPLDGGGMLLVIGDVSGKGLPAAMTVSLLVGTVRTLAHYTQSPGEILAAMNQRMLTRSAGGFTTCLVLRADKDGTLTIANAGHLAPYISGKELVLNNGLPLGLSAATTYAEITLQLSPSQQLTLLTDGVVEARGNAGALFGFERAAAISAQSADQIAKTAELFGQDDDITVLTLARTA
jgi:hypothetical protein